MGVINLWTELVKYANVCRAWSGSARSAAGGGEPRDENAEIVAELCGKVLAIDTSVWLFQCSQQQDLKDAIFDEHARVLYIIIFRIINLLRYGVTPVFVLEGDTPEAKMDRLNQRSLARGFSGRAVGNRRGGRHDALGRKVVELLDAMGIPHVDAPGEAEAMCAALTVVGLAHAAVTSDVDALLFGARRVYKECRVQMDSVRLNTVERVDAGEAARRCFGLRDEAAGCVRALQAVACLCGCDYSVAGGKGVGVKTALEAVQQLTVGKQDDSQVLPELLSYLETGPDPRVTALTKCTGCKTCGHEKHGRQPCAVCGPGPCRPKADSSPCECEFHRSEPQRKFMRVIARAVTTGPSFSSECRATIAAFESETQRAHRAAEELRRREGSISWSRRPNVQAVFGLMHPLLCHTSSDPSKLLWTYPEVRDKMRPVLVEWDMRQGPQPTAAARAVVEFRPRRIKQVAAKDGGLWAYLMEFDRLPDVNPADASFDVQQLSSSKLTKGRHVRRTLVDRLWPHLLQQREEEEQAKLAKPKKGRGAKAAATGSGGLGSPGGVSGSSGATIDAGAAAAPSGRLGARPGPAASGPGVTRSGASAGSSDVMHRFLKMGAASGAGTAGGGGGGGAAAPTTSVQQRQQQQPHGAAGLSGGGVAADTNFAGRPGGGDEEEEEEDGDWMEYDVQATQQNDGPLQRSAAAAARDAAVGAVGPSQVPAWGETRAAAAAAGAGAPRAGGGRGGIVALWDDVEPGDDSYGGGSGGCRTGAEAMYDDLDDVIPTSLDELLGGASQPAAADRLGRGQPQVQQQHQQGGRQRQGRGAAVQVTDTAAAAVAAGSAGPPTAQPFRPQPTGPGPGPRQGPGVASGSGGGHGEAGEDGRLAARSAAALDVFDLTDSPAAGGTKSRTCAAAAAAATTGGHAMSFGLGGSGENFVGTSGGGGGGASARHREPLMQDQQQQPSSRGGGPAVGRHNPYVLQPRRDPEAAAEQEGEDQLRPGNWEEQGGLEGGEEDAIGSAIKPARRPGAAGAPGEEQEQVAAHGSGTGIVTQEQQQQQAVESPAARRARLMRSLFPDVSEDASAAATTTAVAEQRQRRADKAAADGATGARQPQADRRLEPCGVLGSPPKRQNTGDGAGGSGKENGNGGVRGAAAGAVAAAAAPRPAAAVREHVDLTLDDDDSDDDVVDLT